MSRASQVPTCLLDAVLLPIPLSLPSVLECIYIVILRSRGCRKGHICTQSHTCQFKAQPNMDAALTFTHVCVDSNQTALEHHRSFHSHLCQYKPAEREKNKKGVVAGNQTQGLLLQLQVLWPLSHVHCYICRVQYIEIILLLTQSSFT